MRQVPLSPPAPTSKRVANVPEHPPLSTRLMSCARIANRQLPRIIGASIGQGCAPTASCPRLRNDYCHTNSVRIASSLRAGMIFGKDRWKSRAPCSTGMPLPSVEPATPPTDCGSPQTTAVAAVHGRTRKANSRSKVRVGTTHRSIAAMASAWLRRNVRQLCDGGPRRPIMYFETVDSATSNPSFSSSPWIRGAPHNGFSSLIRRMRLHSSCSILGSWPTLGFPAPVGPEPCPMPPQDGGRLHNSSQSQQAWPEPRQPDHQGPVTPPQPQTPMPPN